MDRLRRDVQSPSVQPTASGQPSASTQPPGSGQPTASARRTQRAPERPNRLGRTLREAREHKDLELRDLAEITSVRLTHLEALEAGDYRGLPEEVYSKNFVRLYAQAVGLDPARMLLLYAQERRALPQVPWAGLELPLEPAAPRFNVRFDNPHLGRLLGLLLTPLLVVSVVLAALWAFNGLLFTAEPEPVTSTPAETLTQTSAIRSAAVTSPTRATTEIPTETTPENAATTLTPVKPMILLSLRTTPSGAEISIDGYRFGQSPIVDAPVRAGARAVRVERGGYRTFERTLDLSRDRRLNVELVPTRGAATPTGAATQTPLASARTETQAAQITLSVTAEAWLEVYAGSARGEGERLVYKTAQPGETFSFGTPVYIFSGNAGGVTVARGDAAAEPLGASGAVVGAEY